jgi:hypothetical protein
VGWESGAEDTSATGVAVAGPLLCALVAIDMNSSKKPAMVTALARLRLPVLSASLDRFQSQRPTPMSAMPSKIKKPAIFNLPPFFESAKCYAIGSIEISASNAPMPISAARKASYCLRFIAKPMHARSEIKKSSAIRPCINEAILGHAFAIQYGARATIAAGKITRNPVEIADPASRIALGVLTSSHPLHSPQGNEHAFE